MSLQSWKRSFLACSSQQQLGPQTPTRPVVAPGTIEVFREGYSENEPFFISDIFLLFRLRVIVQLGIAIMGSTQTSFNLLYTILPLCHLPCQFPMQDHHVFILWALHPMLYFLQQGKQQESSSSSSMPQVWPVGQAAAPAK